MIRKVKYKKDFIDFFIDFLTYWL